MSKARFRTVAIASGQSTKGLVGLVGMTIIGIKPPGELVLEAPQAPALPPKPKVSRKITRKPAAAPAAAAPRPQTSFNPPFAQEG